MIAAIKLAKVSQVAKLPMDLRYHLSAKIVMDAHSRVNIWLGITGTYDKDITLTAKLNPSIKGVSLKTAFNRGDEWKIELYNNSSEPIILSCQDYLMELVPIIEVTDADIEEWTREEVEENLIK